MKIDRRARKDAKSYFRAALRPDGSLDERALRRILQLLATRKPHNLLGVLSQIYRLVEQAVDERAVEVCSAAPLADRGKSIFTELETRFGPASKTTYKQDRALLGGIRVRRGSEIWDGTLRTRLQRLQQSLS